MTSGSASTTTHVRVIICRYGGKVGRAGQHARLRSGTTLAECTYVQTGDAHEGWEDARGPG